MQHVGLRSTQGGIARDRITHVAAQRSKKQGVISLAWEPQMASTEEKLCETRFPQDFL
jgi:hypothetical protein